MTKAGLMGQMGEKRLGGRLGTMQDFWLWAFGDLRSNNVRGVFAEWMVAQLLGLEPNPRGSWDNFDLQLRDGRTIEVKASAYLQVWHSATSPPSKIMFTGLKGHKWIEAEQRRSTEGRSFNADLYVFCVQTERDAERWDAFDLAQWDFYLVPVAQLEAYGAGSLQLATVHRFAPRMSADELSAALKASAPD